jgi:putative transposase
MGRYARKTIVDVPYHVIHRGNNRQPIFFCDDDYQFFLESIESAKDKYKCRLYSFVLMTNHVHLLLEPIEDSENLAYFMKHIAQRYGQYVNKHYKRSGTLWEGRFKSSPISYDRYLLACSRYVEMNPVRAGIVEKPEEYKFSSYNAKIGKKKLKMLDQDPVYMALGKTDDERQTAYQRWFQESIPKAEWELIREAVQRNWVFGNNRFKEAMEKALERRFEVKKAGRKPKL